jgi:hypothetical protein
VWVPLVGVQPEMSSDPELSLFYTFREKGYEPDPLLAEGEVKALERELERAAEAKEREEQALGSPPSNDPAPPQANVGVERPASDTPSTPGDEDAAQQPTGTPSGIQPPGADFTRKFKLTIDLRSIKVLRIVPSNLASVYVQAFLPKAAKRATPQATLDAYPCRPLATQ